MDADADAGTDTHTHTEAEGVCSWQLVKEYWGENEHQNAHTYNDLVETVSSAAWLGWGGLLWVTVRGRSGGWVMGRDVTLTRIDKMRSNTMLTESGVITQ